MRESLKIVHILGLALFLGSIAAYIAFTSQHYDPGTRAFAQLRNQISLGTTYVTMPGLVLTLVSGLGLLYANRHRLKRWQVTKAIVGLLLLSNTWLLVAPAIKTAAALSATAVDSPANVNEIVSAVKMETVAGAINVMLACLGIWLAIFRPELRRQRRVRPTMPISSRPET